MSEHQKQDTVGGPTADSNDNPAAFVAPHPGAPEHAAVGHAELVDAPRFTARNWFALLGPGLVMGAAAIGGGEWLAGPLVTAKYGGSLMWLATLSILAQGLYNIEISRYTLYCGEPIFTGKFRTLPGPAVWIAVYLLLDFSSVFPYLAANAATPLGVVLNHGQLPDPDHNASHWWMLKMIASAVFVLSIVPLVFGGKVYNSLKVVMSVKLVLVVGFLLVLAVFYSHSATWIDIITGFAKFGTVPVERGEDLNGNGRLDPGEDWNGDGRLDVVESAVPPSIDTNGDGRADAWEVDENGRAIKFNDVDGDGLRDGKTVENVFVSLWTTGKLPNIDFEFIAIIAALAAIAGNGGLSNTPVSNFTRDQGWGMGYHVGAIPSMVGGRGITLSHVGAVFDPNDDTLPRWRRWYRHILRDQLCVWVPACFVGVALPSMLSVEFLSRGIETDNWSAAAMTAEGVEPQVANPPDDVFASTLGLARFIHGSGWGNFFWALTLVCGFLVLAPSMASTIDGVIRRWVDVFWTASARLREVDTSFIRHLYFGVLLVYGVLGFTMLWLNEPTTLLKIATLGYNFALAFSCLHVLVINTTLLPKPLRPNWFIRAGLVLSCLFFFMLGVVATLKTLGFV